MLKGYKTYITGVVAIVGALGAFLIGEAELGTTVHIVVDSMLAMFVRHGIKTRA